MTLLRTSVFSAFLLVISVSCNLQFKKEAKRIQALQELQQTDVDFSDRSRQVGMKKAFLEYIQDDGVLLRPGKLPVIGAHAVDYLSAINDSSFVLTWRPEGADVSESEDMGYTYGLYNMQMGDSSFKGTYVTVWTRQKDGRWKFVLDSGNEGTGE